MKYETMTDHGAMRMHKRLGIKKKAVESAFQVALVNGKPAKEFKGKLKKFLDREARFYKSTPLIYGQNIYWVSKQDELITVIPVPAHLRKYLKY